MASTRGRIGSKMGAEGSKSRSGGGPYSLLQQACSASFLLHPLPSQITHPLPSPITHPLLRPRGASQTHEAEFGGGWPVLQLLEEIQRYERSRAGILRHSFSRFVRLYPYTVPLSIVMKFIPFPDLYLSTHSGPAEIFLGCAALVLLSILSYAFYNIFLHPLRFYPGPKLWAAFRFPYVYHQVKGSLVGVVRDLHTQHGPVVRIGPDELTYSTASAWREIYGSRRGQPQNPKHWTSLPSPHDGQADSLVMADEANHTRGRRLLAHAFSAKALEEQQPLILYYVDLLVERLKQNTAEPQNMVQWYNWTTFDIIADLTFGESFHGLEEQTYHPWVETLVIGLEAGGLVTAARRYGLNFALQWLIPKEMLQRFDDSFTYTIEKVGIRLERGTERPDFMSYIMRNDKEGSQMSKAELEANAEVLVAAGTETTASVLAGATYYLGLNARILDKVTAEVRNAFDSDRAMSLNALSNLDYLQAVLSETLRLYPPTPSSIPRVTVNGDTVDGKYVPPGTIIGLFQWATNHCSSNFHDPDSFVPERWLPDAPPEFRNDSKDASQPFSMGPHNCIGQNLAWSEMRLILAKILWHFDISLESSKDWIEQRACLVWIKGPLMVRLTPVERGNAGKKG